MKGYPKELVLRDKTTVVVRRIREEDADAVRRLFSRIPKSDLLMYKDDVTRREPLENWFLSQSYRKVEDLVAIRDGEVIAKGTLNTEGLFWPHAAEVKLVVDPEFRGKGLGSLMFNILLYEGLKRQFQKIIVRYLHDNTSFIKILNHYGFEPESVLNYYVVDEDTSDQKDLVVASYDLQTWERRFEYYTYI
ncbi:MAG TPA: GNAT family N-acetyltransferase [Thermodesulfobacteriota bacterium]|nr:GNAT family N-acetyltransferase [Thermodesulfobacteriota bacterium]